MGRSLGRRWRAGIGQLRAWSHLPVDTRSLCPVARQLPGVDRTGTCSS